MCCGGLKWWGEEWELCFLYCFYFNFQVLNSFPHPYCLCVWLVCLFGWLVGWLVGLVGCLVFLRFLTLNEWRRSNVGLPTCSSENWCGNFSSRESLPDFTYLYFLLAWSASVQNSVTYTNSSEWNVLHISSSERHGLLIACSCEAEVCLNWGPGHNSWKGYNGSEWETREWVFGNQI